MDNSNPQHNSAMLRTEKQSVTSKLAGWMPPVSHLQIIKDGLVLMSICRQSDLPDTATLEAFTARLAKENPQAVTRALERLSEEAVGEGETRFPELGRILDAIRSEQRLMEMQRLVTPIDRDEALEKEARERAQREKEREDEHLRIAERSRIDREAAFNKRLYGASRG